MTALSVYPKRQHRPRLVFAMGEANLVAVVGVMVEVSGVAEVEGLVPGGRLPVPGRREEVLAGQVVVPGVLVLTAECRAAAVVMVM